MKLHPIYLSVAACFVFVTSLANAASFDNVAKLTPIEFDSLAKDLGATLSHKSNGPAYSLGLTGFEIGASFGAAKLNNTAAYEKANPSSTLVNGNATHTGLYAVKGLPFGIDIGASLRTLGGYSTYGFDARYSVLQGGLVLPSVVLRAARMSSTDSNNLKFAANSFDASISKAFLFLVPYAGVGTVSTNTSAGEFSANNSQTRVFGGINANFLLMTMGYEYDKTGDTASQAIKLSVKW